MSIITKPKSPTFPNIDLEASLSSTPSISVSVNDEQPSSFDQSGNKSTGKQASTLPQISKKRADEISKLFIDFYSNDDVFGPSGKTFNTLINSLSSNEYLVMFPSLVNDLFPVLNNNNIPLYQATVDTFNSNSDLQNRQLLALTVFLKKAGIDIIDGKCAIADDFSSQTSIFFTSNGHKALIQVIESLITLGNIKMAKELLPLLISLGRTYDMKVQDLNPFISILSSLPSAEQEQAVKIKKAPIDSSAKRTAELKTYELTKKYNQILRAPFNLTPSKMILPGEKVTYDEKVEETLLDFDQRSPKITRLEDDPSDKVQFTTVIGAPNHCESFQLLENYSVIAKEEFLTLTFDDNQKMMNDIFSHSQTSVASHLKDILGLLSQQASIDDKFEKISKQAITLIETQLTDKFPTMDTGENPCLTLKELFVAKDSFRQQRFQKFLQRCIDDPLYHNEHKQVLDEIKHNYISTAKSLYKLILGAKVTFNIVLRDFPGSELHSQSYEMNKLEQQGADYGKNFLKAVLDEPIISHEDLKKRQQNFSNYFSRYSKLKSNQEKESFITTNQHNIQTCIFAFAQHDFEHLKLPTLFSDDETKRKKTDKKSKSSPEHLKKKLLDYFFVDNKSDNSPAQQLGFILKYLYALSSSNQQYNVYLEELDLILNTAINQIPLKDFLLTDPLSTKNNAYQYLTKIKDIKTEQLEEIYVQITSKINSIIDLLNEIFPAKIPVSQFSDLTKYSDTDLMDLVNEAAWYISQMTSIFVSQAIAFTPTKQISEFLAAVNPDESDSSIELWKGVTHFIGLNKDLTSQDAKVFDSFIKDKFKPYFLAINKSITHLRSICFEHSLPMHQRLTHASSLLDDCLFMEESTAYDKHFPFLPVNTQTIDLCNDISVRRKTMYPIFKSLNNAIDVLEQGILLIREKEIFKDRNTLVKILSSTVYQQLIEQNLIKDNITLANFLEPHYEVDISENEDSDSDEDSREHEGKLEFVAPKPSSPTFSSTSSSPIIFARKSGQASDEDESKSPTASIEFKIPDTKPSISQASKFPPAEDDEETLEDHKICVFCPIPSKYQKYTQENYNKTAETVLDQLENTASIISLLCPLLISHIKNINKDDYAEKMQTANKLAKIPKNSSEKEKLWSAVCELSGIFKRLKNDNCFSDAHRIRHLLAPYFMDYLDQPAFQNKTMLEMLETVSQFPLPTDEDLTTQFPEKVVELLIYFKNSDISINNNEQFIVSIAYFDMLCDLILEFEEDVEDNIIFEEDEDEEEKILLTNCTSNLQRIATIANEKEQEENIAEMLEQGRFQHGINDRIDLSLVDRTREVACQYFNKKIQYANTVTIPEEKLNKLEELALEIESICISLYQHAVRFSPTRVGTDFDSVVHRYTDKSVAYCKAIGAQTHIGESILSKGNLQPTPFYNQIQPYFISLHRLPPFCHQTSRAVFGTFFQPIKYPAPEQILCRDEDQIREDMEPIYQELGQIVTKFENEMDMVNAIPEDSSSLLAAFAQTYLEHRSEVTKINLLEQTMEHKEFKEFKEFKTQILAEINQIETHANRVAIIQDGKPHFWRVNTFAKQVIDGICLLNQQINEISPTRTAMIKWLADFEEIEFDEEDENFIDKRTEFEINKLWYLISNITGMMPNTQLNIKGHDIHKMLEFYFFHYHRLSNIYYGKTCEQMTIINSIKTYYLPQLQKSMKFSNNQLDDNIPFIPRIHGLAHLIENTQAASKNLNFAFNQICISLINFESDISQYNSLDQLPDYASDETRLLAQIFWLKQSIIAQRQQLEHSEQEADDDMNDQDALVDERLI